MTDLSAGPPPIPAALVEWLEKVYPDRFPALPQGQDLQLQLQRVAGNLEVVRLLRDHLTRQQRSAPRSTPASA